MNSFPVSLIIPVFNEGKTIKDLLETIKKQRHQPAEIILVDGGSTDNTIHLIKELTIGDDRFKVIEAGRAMPGKGRNIGTEAARYEWIAYTDAGIVLDKDWLYYLVEKAIENPAASIIYGNFSPQLNSLFEQCATITFVPALQPGKIRDRAIPSCLLRKEVWKKAGGFPDWRAAEDLIFMEKVEEQGTITATAPKAIVYWQLRQTLAATYKKFDLYSKYNVWAGKAAFWHYGIAKQYAVMIILVILGFLHSWYWFLLVPVWIMARVTKRILMHRNEFGWKPLVNPISFFLIVAITLTIDIATFSGWLKAVVTKGSTSRISLE